MIFKTVLYILSGLAILSVLLPFIKKDLWIFRVFDYPRLQKFTIIGILSLLWGLFFWDTRLLIDYGIWITLVFSFFYLGYLILPFTPLGKKMIDREMVDATTETLGLLVANVYQYNTSYAKLVQLIESKNADIVFLVETDQKWQDGVKSIKKDYPHCIEIPLDNTYGMLLYSKLPFLHSETNYLIDNEIPSVIVDVSFNETTVRIYGLHPTPPVPQENSHSTDRDAEILMIGKMAHEYEGPCLVIGDLNDVAWSYTTKLFLKISGLLDPRRGRGMYSTFHAKYPFLRWPLDHFFVSSHFRLTDLQVEPTIDSDHFPISISLIIAAKDEENQLEADAEDKQLVEEKIEAGLNDEPI